MIRIPKMRSRALLSVVFVTVAVSAAAQNGHKITTPTEALGFNIGDDYNLATYTQFEAWWKKLATESNRMKLVDIGKTEEGRTQYMAIITSPENQKKLAHYKEISRKLAMAQSLTDDEAHALAREGKAVVWIDGGLHATEVLGAHQLMDFVYNMITRNDPETLRILNDVIILAAHDNPDGMELVSNWYMRERDPKKRKLENVPRLWAKYIGHDNNRDFYANNMRETTNISRQLFIEWFPQIMYNHHQTGPAGAVMFAPPFRDPFNYHFDAIVPMELDLVGAAMHSRFVVENKPGTTMRTGAAYSTWYNGGLRTVTYFHNIIGLLTETIGSPTPMEVPLVPDRQLAKGDLPLPVPPQTWHFKQSIDYSMTANLAVLDLASRYREELLYNIYRMGKNSIDRGNTDSWTITPKRIEAVKAAATKESAPAPAGGRRGGAAAAPAAGPGGNPDFFNQRGAGSVPAKLYASVLHDPADRDPRGYIVPSDQPDFPTATKFINALIKSGVTVHRATAAFTVAGKQYPANSWVVKSAQAFRPHVLDMFEPQDHPNDFQYPGGPPIPPYDVTGYTLALQMGVKFDRIMDGFDGPFQKVAGEQKPPAGKVSGPSKPAGYLISHDVNDSFVIVNRLLKNGDEVYWVKQPITVSGRQEGPGSIYVPARPETRPVLERSAAELGVNAEGVASAPSGEAYKLKPVRIGLWDQYGGSMPSGWLRWIFDQFEFPYEVVYPAALDAGSIASKFDVLVFPSGAMPRATGETGRGGFGFAQPSSEEIPEEWRSHLGRVTAEKTVPQLRKFVEAGGAIVTVGDSTSLAQFFGLPMKNGLAEKTADGQERPLPREKFYVPGSILQASVDNTNPVAYGMGSTVDVFFENSPVFRMAPDADSKGLKPVAWFPNASPLRSGWAWGQAYLENTVSVAEAPVGEGKIFLLGAEAAFRGQPHGTYKLLFNSIYFGPSKPITLPR